MISFKFCPECGTPMSKEKSKDKSKDSGWTGVVECPNAECRLVVQINYPDMGASASYSFSHAPVHKKSPEPPAPGSFMRS